MTEVFLKLLRMSLSAGWLVLAVLVFRLLLRRAPKWMMPVLWGMVALRLMLPVTPVSTFSLQPPEEDVDVVVRQMQPSVSSVPAIVKLTPDSGHTERPAPAVTEPLPEETAAMPLSLLSLLTLLWAAGVALMLCYGVWSFLRLRRRMRTADLLWGNIYRSQQTDTPFLLGFFHPKIYLPSGLSPVTEQYVVAHEQAHLQRKDQWCKLLGYLLLAVYWFHPLLWLGYVLFCRDIELACDERVIQQMNRQQRADYSQALLACSTARRPIAACPLAFGGGEVKGRIRSVLRYKKPAFWVIAAAVVLCLAAAVCFLTDPPGQDTSPLYYKNLQTLAEESISLQLEYTPDGQVYSVSSEQVGDLLKQAQWRQWRFYDKSNKSAATLTVIFDQELSLQFYRQEPRLAVIRYQQESRFYRMENMNYDDVAALLLTTDPQIRQSFDPIGRYEDEMGSLLRVSKDEKGYAVEFGIYKLCYMEIAREVSYDPETATLRFSGVTDNGSRLAAEAVPAPAGDSLRLTLTESSYSDCPAGTLFLFYRDSAQAGPVERLTTLRAEDIREISLSGWGSITAQQLAEALNGAARQLSEPVNLLGHYQLTAYLSEDLSQYPEMLQLAAGLEENLVQAVYSRGSETWQLYFRDKALYQLLRGAYHLEEHIQQPAFDLYHLILEQRAEQSVRASQEAYGAAPFTGYEICRFYQVEDITRGSDIYSVYSWEPVFTAEDPDRIPWAGGMMMDAKGRIVGYESDTYFVVKNPQSSAEISYRFLPWDLYAGEDEAVGKESAWRKIQSAFSAETETDR